MAGYPRDPAKWALTPDESDPSTWRLPLYRAGSDKPDAKLVAYALGRLSPDADPTIPVKLAKEVRARVRRAYRSIHGLGVTLPDAIAKALDLFVAGSGRGVMVALAPPGETADRLAVAAADGIEPEPVEQLHLTLCYLGTVEEWPEDRLTLLRGVVASYCAERWPLWGATTGGGILLIDPTQGAEAAAVALVDAPGLAAFRTGLVDELVEVGIWPASEHDFLPHITIAYGTVDACRALPVPDVYEVAFGEALVVAGERVDRFPLAGLPGDDDELPESVEDVAFMATTKAVEHRYTFAPMYVPDAVDAHGEKVSVDDLQAMVWDYMRSTDHTVRFWHLPETVAGEVVEMVCWPTEQTVTMREVSGATREVVLPAGTVYAGVVWEPWAWTDVKDGFIRAYSWGGVSRRVAA